MYMSVGCCRCAPCDLGVVVVEGGGPCTIWIIPPVFRSLSSPPPVLNVIRSVGGFLCGVVLAMGLPGGVRGSVLVPTGALCVHSHISTILPSQGLHPRNVLDEFIVFFIT